MSKTMDLRSFLNDPATPVFRPDRPLSVVQEITAVQHALAARGRQPVVFVAQPRLADGGPAAMPVATNLFASRQLVARMFGIDDHRRTASSFMARADKPVAPTVVGETDAPVREVVSRGGDADLRILPALRQHEGDSAHYLTAAHVVTYDPESGIDNTSMQRCAVRGPRYMTSHVSRFSHNGRNVARFWARGEACPVALWIGHHPAVAAGAQAKMGYPESHWGAAGGLAGTSIRLVPTLTHGERIMVPADAEIVIEGWIPPHRREADGPLGEYHGYMGQQIPCVTMEVDCITHRRDAIYQDCGAGLHDHLIPDNLAIEGSVYAAIKPVAPSLVNVHAPFSGRRFHIYLQFKSPAPGEARDALTAALALRRHRTVIAVDDDIDIFDDSRVMWALATRIQWHRDFISVDGLTRPNLDPSLPPGAATVTKAAIDATLPSAPGPGLPRPFLPPVTVAEDPLRVANEALVAADDTEWPTA